MAPAARATKRFVLHARAATTERPFVAEVAGLETAVEAEQQVGAALVGAERLDEELRAVRVDAEVGRGSPGVDAGRLELAHGDARRRRARRRWPACVGRREGRPASHQDGGAGEPAGGRGQQRVERQSGRPTKAVTSRPSISAHPARRARRSSHGAAAVSAAAIAAMPAVVGNPSRSADRDRCRARRATVRRSVSIPDSSSATSARRAARRGRRCRASATAARRAPTSRPPSTTTARTRVADHDGVDDPLRERRRDRAGGPTAKPTSVSPNSRLEEEEGEQQGGGDDQAQHVGRGALDLRRDLPLLVAPTSAPVDRWPATAVRTGPWPWPVELGLGDDALVAEVGEPGDLVCGAAAAARS